MAYTALEKVRALNKLRYGIDAPVVPDISELRKRSGRRIASVADLEKNAVDFIRNSCEELLFNRAYPNEHGLPMGKSLLANEIPYNMEKDIDRLCMENAIHKFVETGSREDAFDIYFCFIDIFFGNEKNTSRKLIELISQFEAEDSKFAHSAYVFLIGLAIYQTSSAFRKAYATYYRTAIAEGDDKVRARSAAGHFLKYWGMASLFHDIGYKLESSFELIKNSFGNTLVNVPYTALKGIDNYTRLKLKPEEEAEYKKLPGEIAELKKLLDNTEKTIAAAEAKTIIAEIKGGLSRKTAKLEEYDRYYRLNQIAGKLYEGPGEADSIDNMLAWGIARRLYKIYSDYPEYKKFVSVALGSEERDADKLPEDILRDVKMYAKYMKEGVLAAKASSTDTSDGHMDHAYFSAVILCRAFLEFVDEKELSSEYMDVLVAIVLHNSIYRNSVTNTSMNDEKDKHNGYNLSHRFAMGTHPLSYLLMLADSLQSWNNLATDKEIGAIDCELSIKEEARKLVINAKYVFDKDIREKAQKRDEHGLLRYEGLYKKLATKTRSYVRNEDESVFLTDIENLLEINGNSGIQVRVGSKFDTRKHFRENFSECSYIHLYDLALMCTAMDQYDGDAETPDIIKIDNHFNKTSLEYKLDKIDEVKALAVSLAKLGCFYTDKPTGFRTVKAFSEDEMKVISTMEHQRWLLNHYHMGWVYGSRYAEKPSDQVDTDRIQINYINNDIKNINDDKNVVREITRTHKRLLEDADYTTVKMNENYENLSYEAKGETDLSNLIDLMEMMGGLKICRVYR